MQSAGGPKPCGIHFCYPRMSEYKLLGVLLDVHTAQGGQFARSVGSPAVLVASNGAAESKSRKATYGTIMMLELAQ